MNKHRTVVVDEAGLSFHHPTNLESTWGMERVIVKEARRRGAVACSQCFKRVEPPYNFDRIWEVE